MEIIKIKNNKNLVYLNLIKKMINNLLKLYKKTEINKRNEILSVLTDVLPKQLIRTQRFIFSDTMYRTVKRKNCETEKRQIEANKK